MSTSIRPLHDKDVHFLPDSFLSSFKRTNLDEHLCVPIPGFPNTLNQNLMIGIRLGKRQPHGCHAVLAQDRNSILDKPTWLESDEAHTER